MGFVCCIPVHCQFTCGLLLCTYVIPAPQQKDISQVIVETISWKMGCRICPTTENLLGNRRLIILLLEEILHHLGCMKPNK